MSKIEEIIQKIEYFPDQPGAAYKILAVIDAPGTTMEDLVKYLRFDISTTANILKLCNSLPSIREQCPDLEEGKRIGSIEEALQYLGKAELKNLITMTASTDIFSRSSAYEVRRGEMRRHSIAVAVLSRHMLPYAPKMTGDLFTACLLHDVGKIILSEYIGDHYEEIIRRTNETKLDFAEIEKDIVGLTHAEVGARIMEKWQFPEEMVTAVRYHHEPEAVPDSPLTHFISLANTLARLMGFSTGIDAMCYKGSPGIFKKYKMKEKDLELISMDALEEINSAIAFERRQDRDAAKKWPAGEERRKEKGVGI